MVFDVPGLINLILYCAQQLGIALGLGAQTIMLVAYVLAMRDRAIDKTEAQFLRATRATLWISLVLIVTSGLVITALHLAAGQGATVFTAAYLFKILLIATVILLTALLHTLPETFAEGLLGGTWYALFLVHILAPVASWTNFFTLWAVWLVGFNLLWYVVVFSTRESAGNILKPVAKPVPKPQPVPLPIPKPPHKPFFNFFTKKEKPKVVPIPVPEVVSQPIVPVVVPAEFKPIQLDMVPRTPPVVIPQTAAPVAIPTTVTPPAPAQQIKIDPVPKAAPTEPVEKMPASQTTDTPFLPQVPPLQPIPTIPPAPGVTPSTPAPTVVPVQPTPAISPEVKLGLNVMPKSPDQLK